jgi:hypothetical protein
VAKGLGGRYAYCNRLCPRGTEKYHLKDLKEDILQVYRKYKSYMGQIGSEKEKKGHGRNSSKKTS